MAGSITTTPPSAPNHYIVVVHGIGEQKLNTTIPPVIHRFAEVRQNRDERYYEIVLPATQSSQSVRSENEEHGWAEYRGIPVQDKESQEEFDGTPPTNTAGENFRFVELYWQNILQRHQEKFASETEDWVKAMLNRLTDSAITPKEWVPSWGIPMLESIANMAVPLKKMLAFKYASATELIFNGYLGDVHLYGDYARTRGESVRHFHTELDRIIFFDFLDWRKRELDAGLLVPGRYQKPEITIIAHSLGSVMSFDALVYAFAKKEIRESSAESVKYSSSFPFFGYTSPYKEGESIYDKYKTRLEKFIQYIKEPFTKKVIYDVLAIEYKKLFNRLYDALTYQNKSIDDKKELLEELNCQMGGLFPISEWLALFAENNNQKLTEEKKPLFERIKDIIKQNDADDLDLHKRIEIILHEDDKKIKKFINEHLIIDDLDKEKVLHEFNDLIKVDAINSHLKEILVKVDEMLKVYWSTFYEGCCGEENLDIIFQKTVENNYQTPDLNENALKGVPLLLWRQQVKNFITIGAPIDKYLALWQHNYLHLGLKLPGYTTPARLRFPCECQYEFPESLTSRKIRHYNFCDEQDPVGHHLDITRRTEVYPQIFDNTDTKRRDVVYRRYSVPGLAHNMYWQDGELFKGILREILDRKPHEAGKIGTSSFFIRDEFRNRKNAEKEGLLWAYYRIPFIASLITGLIIAFGIKGVEDTKPVTKFIYFAFAAILWVMPNILTFYKTKSSFEGIHRSRFRLFFGNILSRGIFLRLISLAVEWRRIAVSQSEGNAEDDSENGRLVFQQKGEWWTWWPFVWRWGWRMLVTVLLGVVVYVFLNEENYLLLIHYMVPDTLYVYVKYIFSFAFVKNVADILLPVFIVYVLAMIIVFWEYFRFRINYSKINKISE